MQNETQTDMKFESPDKGDNRWFAPLSRNNLFAVLAGGVIAPHSSYEDYENDLQHFAGNAVLLVRNGISSALLDSGFLAEVSGFTVLVEINMDGLPENDISGIDEKGKSCKIKLSDGKSDARFISFPGVIPVTRISAIHFRSDSDKKNFIARGFENVPTDIIPLSVSEKLFNQELSDNIFKELKNLSQGETETALKASYEKS